MTLGLTVISLKEHFKFHLIKIKNICSLKDTVKKIKRQATEWEKIFAKHVPDKGLISRIQKRLLHLNDHNINNSIRMCKKFQQTLKKINVWHISTRTDA